MGRKRTKNLNLPDGVRARVRGHKTFYYLDIGGKPRKELPLGSDYVQMFVRWGELRKKEGGASNPTLKYVLDEYALAVIPTKAPRTQKDNHKEIANLLRFFNDPPITLDMLTPVLVRKYMTWRNAPIRATREKALLSHAWNWAREHGHTALPNPCTGIRGKASKRDYYPEDDVYQLVYAEGGAPLREAMDLAYAMGQRPADIIKLSEADIRNDVAHVRQGKTKRKLRVVVEALFADTIERIRLRKSELRVTSLKLLVTTRGAPLTQTNLRRMFDEARAAAAKKASSEELRERIQHFQYRDLRAKAGTDKEEIAGREGARKMLGHTSDRMTDTYLRNRKGDLVRPSAGMSGGDFAEVPTTLRNKKAV